VNGAGRNDHSAREKRSTREPATNIFQRIIEMGERLELGGRCAHFQMSRPFSGPGQNQMEFNIGIPAQPGEQSMAVDGSACTRNGNYDPQKLSSEKRLF
jgi:hypothetical protein